ncbi:ribonuclease Z [Halobacteriales archaeon QH_7_69_31]|nr:MAG: ribonuclease Z [Halobacteriales archaeon QH_7_69_31]
MSLCVTFLGTGGAVPTTQRNTSAVFVRREGDRMLFDCGEGTQRQMMRFGTGFGVDHVFVTHLHGDHVLGIPGLLQTMDFNERTDPIAIHVPAGTRSDVEDLVSVAGGRPEFPVRVNAVEAGAPALSTDDYEVRGFATDHDARSVGYALIEDERKGRFDRERAEELGVPVGPKFQRLHGGDPVELEDGTVVEPDQVVGDPRPGRTVAYTGDTRPTAATVEAADGADLLVHDATFASDNADRAARTAHATAVEAAEVANDAGAARLALVHLSSRYAGDATPIESEAVEVFQGECALVPDDGEAVDVPFPE